MFAIQGKHSVSLSWALCMASIFIFAVLKLLKKFQMDKGH